MALHFSFINRNKNDAIDKKNDRKGFNLILLKEIGESLVHTIGEQELEDILGDILELAL